MLDLAVQGGYRIMNIYVPNDPASHLDFLKQISSFVRDNNTILLGDFNLVIEGRDHLSGRLDGTSCFLMDLLSELNFEEILGPHQTIFTYHHLSLQERKSHLDRIYVNFVNKYLNGYTSHISTSDHYLVGMFEILPKDFGPKMWKFNSDILLDLAFGDRVRLACSNFGSMDVCEEWERLKGKFQEYAMLSTQYHVKQAKREVAALQKTLSYINQQIYAGDNMEVDHLKTESRLLHCCE